MRQAQRFTEEVKAAVIEKATLKKATDLDDCADAFVMIAKNTSMTGQMVTVGKCAERPVARSSC